MASLVCRLVMRDVCSLQLFANVLKHHVVKLDYQQLARAMGDNVTPKAISHRIAKIKEKAQAHRNRWDPYIRLVASTKRVASLKHSSMLDEECDDEEEKGLVDLKSEDEQLFAANLESMDGGGASVGDPMPSFDGSGGGEVGDAVVAAADRGGGGGGRECLLGVCEQGHLPVPASEYEIYGMYQAAERVGEDKAGVPLHCVAPRSYPPPIVVDHDGLPQNGSGGRTRGGGDFCNEGVVCENST
ncbi:hypothetical protein L873DRAFT_1806416 [Choiromyces venosus 120613-1]|uniref:Uncharacterized protein n=1 Tax=Choiromyces venosus 120613-1 TaxID=1336337 RepID=A0A3N4JTQ9_9PEZI|nr:hypothetical protein L873DRAFT_1806416 [Choiromyces venosus 120613-1]